MSSERHAKNFPDFFTTKGPIQTNVKPLYFGNNIYWMSSVASNTTEENPKQNYLRPYEDNEEGLIDCGDIEENYDIVLTKSGKFMTSFYVPSSLLSFIIGPKGSKLKSLQKNTNTVIKIPKLNETGDVKITGDTERKVASARTQISMIVFQRKDKLPVSHFVSIPMCSDSVEAKFKEFQENILRDPPRGVSRSIFQSPKKLHLTIITIKLVDEEEIEAAKQVFKKCYDEIILNLFMKNQTYNIVLQGLEIMNDDPSEVNVLYGNVHMSDKKQTEQFQEMADKIADYFYMAGLARKQYDRVKLHVTLMNTRYRNPEERNESFDAMDILKGYKDFYFGSVVFKKIHLSIRFTSGDNAYYEPALVLEI